MQIVLSDESLNRAGFRVLTAGIRIENFARNPVMFYCHLRTEKDSGAPILPIGKWELLTKQSGKLLGSPIFDMDDPFARNVSSKFNKGMLNTASIAIEPLTVSDDPIYKMPGQHLPTIIESELIEVSIADIPVNQNAVRLSMAPGYSPLLGSKVGATAYEALWKSDKLWELKEKEPTKFKLLQAEYFATKGLTRKKDDGPVANAVIKELSMGSILDNASRYDRLWKENKLEHLKTTNIGEFETLRNCWLHVERMPR